MGGAGVTDAGGVALADEAVDAVLSGFVSADAIVTAFDSADVFEQDIAAIAVDIKAVVVGVGGGEIAEDEVGVVTAELDACATNRDADVCLG